MQNHFNFLEEYYVLRRRSGGKGRKPRMKMVKRYRVVSIHRPGFREDWK